MAQLKPIPEHEASGEAARVYEEIRETLGIVFVPNFFKTLANSPTALRATWEAYRNVSWRGNVPTVLKEMMFVAISAARKCHYCETAHLAFPESGVRYFGDTQRLQQAFGNLLSNAIKFATKAGQRIEVRMERIETLARISVRDDGPGIEPEFLPDMFEAFRQADSTTTRAHGGLGLGLTIARYVVELHNGTLRAESPGAGLGAVLIVELPLPAVRDRAEPGDA